MPSEKDTFFNHIPEQSFPTKKPFDIKIQPVIIKTTTLPPIMRGGKRKTEK